VTDHGTDNRISNGTTVGGKRPQPATDALVNVQPLRKSEMQVCVLQLSSDTLHSDVILFDSHGMLRTSD
jgi:hypothetical protein